MVIIANLKDNEYMSAISPRMNLVSKNFLLVIALAVISITTYLTLAINSEMPKSATRNEVDTAINQAKYLYKLKVERKEDLSFGPCLSDALMPNWVVDIVHSPRQPVDDLPENQCPSFREGRAKHFVELDLDGNLIIAQ